MALTRSILNMITYGACAYILVDFDVKFLLQIFEI